MLRLNYAIILIITLLDTGMAAATEISVYGGIMNHSAISGCCRSSGGQQGGGAIGMFELKPLGQIGLSVYSDGRWSEGIVSKPFYLYGRPAHTDGGAGQSVEIFSISNWRWVTLVGVGYFSHTARQAKFDIPVLVSGFVLSDINEFLYTVNDHWSVGALLQISAGFSASDTSSLIGTFLTVGYRFK